MVHIVVLYPLENWFCRLCPVSHNWFFFHWQLHFVAVWWHEGRTDWVNLLEPFCRMY